MTDLKKEGAASQPVISIDSLAPAAIERKAESIGVTKNALTLSRLIPLALAAGFFIGLGGLYFTLFMADSSLSFAVQRFAGALMFSLGLALVIICGAELFTGNSLMIGALASRKIPVGGMLRNWIWVWIFNLVGAVILVTLVYLSDTPKLGQMGATMMKIAAGKVSLGWGTLFFKGILCNVLVCLAVWMGFAAHSVADKILAVLLPVSAFVALGFEHCVANMYFLPMGYLLASSGFPAPAGFDPSVITIPGIFYNLSAVTLGNLVGGFMVALVYWWAFARRRPDHGDNVCLKSEKTADFIPRLFVLSERLSDFLPLLGRPFRRLRAAIRMREHLVTGFCHDEGVFPLRGKGMIFRHHRPSVSEIQNVAAAGIHHRLNREHHARLKHDARGREILRGKGIVRHPGLTVENTFADTVAAVLAHCGVTGI